MQVVDRRLIVFVFSILLLLTFQVIFAQINNQKFYQLTRNSGLSQSTVNCIAEDSVGYMWLGTNEGLNKFDGYRFTYYKYDPMNENSIGLGRVRTLFVDSKGRLWIGTDQSGLYLYLAEKDNFIRYPRTLDKDSKSKFNDIRDILETDDGRFWIATFGDGLILFDPDTDLALEFKNNQIFNINSIEYFNNDLYIGAQTGVFRLKDAKPGQDTITMPQPIPMLSNMEIFCLHSGNDGLLWVGTYGNGAYSYNTVSGKIIEYSTQQTGARKLNHDIVRDIIDEKKDGSLLIGTGGGGIDVLNAKRNKIEYIMSKLSDQFSLNTNIIYSFFQDREDNLWIGTYNGGANILFWTKDKFRHIKSFGGKNDLSNNSILSIIEAGNGELWIGTDGGGLELYDPSKKIFHHFRHDPMNRNSLSGDVVKSLLLDDKGILWVGSFNAGLTAFDVKKGTYAHFTYNPATDKSISQNHIWDIAEDKDGNIWLATLGGGLDMYNTKQKTFLHFRNDPSSPSSLSDNVLSCLLYDSKGTLWVGTEFGGVNRLIDKSKGIFRVYNRFGKEGLISSNQISTIFEDSRGNIWVGTIGGGLNLYDAINDRFTSYTEANGLANNLIYAILEDNDGNLWISTNNGLSKFIHGTDRPAKAAFKNYTVGDGLQSNEFSPQSACKASDGTLYFGGINGINYFDPSNIVFNTHIPPVVITDFKIFNKSVSINRVLR
jgi:two-component system sensor histidine kinase ChiS